MVRQGVHTVELHVRGSKALMERFTAQTAIRKFGEKGLKMWRQESIGKILCLEI